MLLGEVFGGHEIPRESTIAEDAVLVPNKDMSHCRTIIHQLWTGEEEEEQVIEAIIMG